MSEKRICQGTVISTGRPCTNDAAGGNGEFCGQHCKCSARNSLGLKCGDKFLPGFKLCQKHHKAALAELDKKEKHAEKTKEDAKCARAVADAAKKNGSKNAAALERKAKTKEAGTEKAEAKAKKAAEAMEKAAALFPKQPPPPAPLKPALSTLASILADAIYDGITVSSVNDLIVHENENAGATLLHVAAWNGRVDLIEKLIEVGADVHAQALETKSSPLHWAVQNNQFEAVSLLRKRGADPAMKNALGRSPWDDAFIFEPATDCSRVSARMHEAMIVRGDVRFNSTERNGSRRLESLPGKTRVYAKIPGSMEAIRSAYTGAIRDKTLRFNRGAVRSDRERCSYTGKPLAYDHAGVESGLKLAEVEHIIEGQMAAFVVVHCDNVHLKQRLKGVELSLPGFVRDGVFRPHYRVHNADANIAFTDHSLNMKKKGFVESCLNVLAGGGTLERDFREELAVKVQKRNAGRNAPPAMSEEEASLFARNVTAHLRHAEDAYSSALGSVGQEGEEKAFSNVEKADRPKLLRMYADMSDEMGQLFGALRV